MIQESVNQLITTAGIAARLSPAYEQRQEADKLLKAGLSAERGLADIESSISKVEAGEKPAYSEAELKDISNRVGQHVSAIGDLKTGAIEGQRTAKYIPKDENGKVKGLSPREAYSERLTNIETKLSAMREKALQSMPQKEEIGRTSTVPSDSVEVNKRVMDYLKNKARAKLEQDKQFKELRNIIYYDNKDLAEAGVPGILGENYYVPLNPKGSVMSIKEYDEMDRKKTHKLYERRNIEKYGKNYRNNPEYLKEVQDDFDTIFD